MTCLRVGESRRRRPRSGRLVLPLRAHECRLKSAAPGLHRTASFSLRDVQLRELDVAEILGEGRRLGGARICPSRWTSEKTQARAAAVLVNPENQKLTPVPSATWLLLPICPNSFTARQASPDAVYPSGGTWNSTNWTSRPPGSGPAASPKNNESVSSPRTNRPPPRVQRVVRQNERPRACSTVSPSSVRRARDDPACRTVSTT
jgi:hypothetical protein